MQIVPTVTQAELEARLWAAANALRGPVDPADFKNYVFPMLFFKWASDTWDLEHSEAIAEAGEDVTSEEEADYHRFVIPRSCHWSEVTAQAADLGLRLRTAFDKIQQANATTLAGIFGSVDWADKERIPEANLYLLTRTFNGLTLNRSVIPNDMLGNAYEYLLRQFADESGRKAGEFFTPRAVVHTLVEILDPQPGESVYDPACGSGGMLVETSNAVRASGGDTRTLRLYGQEVNSTTSAIARMNLYLHDLEDFQIIRDDTLREPRLLDSQGGLRKFDVVIANPPFSLKNWGQEVWGSDPYSRGFCGTPPANSGDYAWIQHMIASTTTENGRVGVVMPNGVLFRAGAEAKIRQCLVESDLLDTVIGLPPNLFYSTTIPACLLIFRSSKQGDRIGRVLFIDAAKRYEKGRNQNYLNAAEVADIVSAYREPSSASALDLKLVSTHDIQHNSWDLSVSRYVNTAQQPEFDITLALQNYTAAEAALGLAQQDLATRLREAGYA